MIYSHMKGAVKSSGIPTSAKDIKLTFPVPLAHKVDIVRGKHINTLKAENNVLTIDPNVYYMNNPKGNEYAIMITHPDGGRFMANYDEIITPVPSEGYGDLWRKEDYALSTFLSALRSGSFWGLEGIFSRQQIFDYLEKFNIKTGDWVTVHSTVHGKDKTTTFYLDENGRAWSVRAIEDTRNFLNNTNWLEQDRTRDSVFVVNGVEYRPDENGNLNIPKGVLVLPDQSTIKWPPRNTVIV
jgi:hypothetical protein